MVLKWLKKLFRPKYMVEVDGNRCYTDSKEAADKLFYGSVVTKAANDSNFSERELKNLMEERF